MTLRTSLLVLLALSCPSLAQSPKRPPLNPLSLLNTSSIDALAGNFRAALRKAMPAPLYEEARIWGRAEEGTTIQWRSQGLQVHPEGGQKRKNEGDWRKGRLTADN